MKIKYPMIVYVQLEVSPAFYASSAYGDRTLAFLVEDFSRTEVAWPFRIYYTVAIGHADAERFDLLHHHLVSDERRCLFFHDEYNWEEVVRAAVDHTNPRFRSQLYDWRLRPW